MANNQEFITGDSRPYVVNLKINDVNFEIPIATSSIKCAIVSVDKKTIYSSAPLIVQSNIIGSDWSESTIVVKFQKKSTSDITYQGNALLEIQVTFNVNLDDEYDLTWFVPISLVKGNVF